MGFFRKLLGGRTAEEERARADELLRSGDYGGAKLAYENARDKAEDEELRSAIEDSIDHTKDLIAKGRIERARHYVDDEEIDLARSEIEAALEVAASDEVKAEAQAVLDELERDEAVERAGEIEISDEDRLAALSASWEEAQAEEYEEYGEEFEKAMLLLLDGKPEESVRILDGILDEAEEPRYLWWEVGRAYFEIAGMEEKGEEALQTFIECMNDDEGGDARLSAHMLLAGLAEKRSDVEAAIAELERAAQALDDDPRPLRELGRYLRSKGRAEEAVEVLEMAMQTGDGDPGWPVIEELGLAYAQAGEDEKAIETLESLISLMVARRIHDFPVAATVALAALHEKHDRKERAADLYRSLADGSDRRNHVLYHFQAGRLLADLELHDEARRMLKRAAAIADDLEKKRDSESSSIPDRQGPVTDDLEKTAAEADKAALAELREKVGALLSDLDARA
jgi:tetratricopeptide (TPR) repeat protein